MYVAQHPAEAHLVKGLLESRGIPAEVQGDSLFGVRGAVPITPDTLPSVWVLDERQVPGALEALRDHESVGTSATTGEPWRCPNCGETVEHQFTACWNCGVDSPGKQRRKDP